MAGEEEDLAVLGDSCEGVDGGGHAVVIEVDKRVIEDDGAGIFAREELLAQCEAQGKVDLVDGAAAQIRALVRHGVALGADIHIQHAVEREVGVRAVRELRESLRRRAGECRGCFRLHLLVGDLHLLQCKVEALELGFQTGVLGYELPQAAFLCHRVAERFESAAHPRCFLAKLPFLGALPRCCGCAVLARGAAQCELFFRKRAQRLARSLAGGIELRRFVPALAVIFKECRDIRGVFRAVSVQDLFGEFGRHFAVALYEAARHGESDGSEQAHDRARPAELLETHADICESGGEHEKEEPQPCAGHRDSRRFARALAPLGVGAHTLGHGVRLRAVKGALPQLLADGRCVFLASRGIEPLGVRFRGALRNLCFDALPLGRILFPRRFRYDRAFRLQGLNAFLGLGELLRDVVHCVEARSRVRDLRFQLRQASRAVVAALALQRAQTLRGFRKRAALLPRCDEGGDFFLQLRRVAHAERARADERRALEYRQRRSREHLADILPGDTGDRLARAGVYGGKFAHRGIGRAGRARERDVLPLVGELHRALHRGAAPRRIQHLIRLHPRAGALRGVHAVEHGAQEGAPGRFAVFVRCFDDIETLLQLERAVL